MSEESCGKLCLPCRFLVEGFKRLIGVFRKKAPTAEPAKAEAEYENKIYVLEQERARLEQELTKTNTLLEETLYKTTRLETELGTRQNNMSHSNATATEVDKRAQEIEQLSLELQEKDKELRLLKEQLKQLKAEIEVKEEDIALPEAEADKKSQEIEQLTLEMQRKDEELRQVKEQLERREEQLKAEIEAKEKDIARLQSALEQNNGK